MFVQILPYLHQILLKEPLLELRSCGAFVFEFAICIQVRIFICSCICIGQELAFLFLLGDSNMISVFGTLSGLVSLGIFLFLISHVDCNLIPVSFYKTLVSSKTAAAESSVDFEGIRPIIFVLHVTWVFSQQSIAV